MAISETISQHVPFLRRFGRALTGTQADGDAYVMATLEAIVADPADIKSAADVRIALYRRFLQCWSDNPMRAIPEASAYGDEAGAQRHLGAMSLRPRIAFLLGTLEGFDQDQIAQVMDCSVATVDRLLADAGQEISEQIATSILIIEDEPFIAFDLQALVEDLGHNVVNVARTHKEAVSAAKMHKPGLILADIHLADGSSGLDAVNEILASFEAPVIFITAYPERFLTGQAPEPAFLIAKPYVPGTVKAVVSQALFFDRKSQRRDQAVASR
ncbi:MAG: response regulator [Rhizobiales bacterium 62-17]|nr:response regulator [Hyphomicrobiales bacterium]OJY00155.1 MAG: response regulator [Rhizobiales bacterium 62-17]